MKKLVTLAAALAIAIPLMAPRAEAQFTFMPYLGFDLDMEELFLGVAAEFNLMPANGLPFGLSIRPGIEYYLIGTEREQDPFFGDAEASASLLQINAEVIGHLVPGPIGVYAGAGLGLGMFSSEVVVNGQTVFEHSTTEVGLNLLGGAEFGTGFAVPFAQVRLTTAGTSRIQLMGGLKLGL